MVLPYVRRRIEHRLDAYRDEIESNEATTEYVVAKKRAIQLYGWVTAAYDAAQVLQYVVYMANLSQSHSLLLRALRMNLVYLPPDESAEGDWSLSDLFHRKMKYSPYWRCAN